MDKIKDIYTQNVDKYNKLTDRTGRILLYLSLSRLIVFIAGIALMVILWKVNQVIAVGSFLAALIIFIVLLKKYSDYSFRKEYYENLEGINKDELRGLDDDYSCFKGGSEYIDPHHDFSHDIDLFGNDSLYQYLNRTCTGRGKDLLAEYLSSPSLLSNKMTERQEAIKELSGLVQWRQEFRAYGMIGDTDAALISDFNEWLREKPRYLNNKAFSVLRIFMPLLTILLLILTITATIHYSLFVLIFLINLVIISFNLRDINNIHSRVTKKHNMLKTLRHLIDHFENHKFSSAYLNNLQKALSSDNGSASRSIDKLSKIIQAFDSRLNMLMAIPLDGMLLWDLQCINRLELWKRTANELLPQWFESLGQVDALCSLANYARNNDTFCYPAISDDKGYLVARSIGHPLIPGHMRVNNDFSISKKGEIIIITGANMAGKSTFLRTVAVNLILAMTGAPVCADKFIFTPCNIYSSMRTTDSLSDQESYFYAELKRLRALKERLENNENIFFLLDEILKGTNSKDKSEGAQLFTERIIQYQATGMIATHDILLGKLSDNYNNIINRCFEIEIAGDEVKFDYILREGMTTKMNAAILMKQMGIV